MNYEQLYWEEYDEIKRKLESQKIVKKNSVVNHSKNW